jgi:hypothetical protein
MLHTKTSSISQAREQAEAVSEAVRCEVDRLKGELEEAAARTAEVGCVC